MAGEYGLGTARGAIIITYDGAGVAKADAQVAALEGKTASAGRTMAKTGKTFAVAGAVIAGGLAIAAKSASDFQSKLTLLVTAAGESPKALGAIGDGIKKIAVETGTSLDQLADGMYLAEKAGYRSANGLKVLRAAAQGARAENVDLATFTNALTSVMTSYGYSADEAVRATNEMIVASGRSKTTMQEFAGSLATILPIASALGLSFAQVGGAVATLTQHGTSAREATMELANLVRNLAGQNNVASSAMQQLGIDTIDLQKNLGKRGLTGTLEIVENALARHSKAGLIVVDAFRKSQLAASSLDTMLSKMPPHLQDMSKKMLAGKFGFKDYRLAANNMGGQLGAMALQFMGLVKSSQGFNDQLKSGQGDVRTAAATLQKMLGGATGLRTALQLGGTSAGLFKSNVKAIGAEAGKSGKNIDTWGRTSQTAAVKFGQLKAAGQVFGVTMGEAVLPAMLAIVKAGTGMLRWLASLPAPVQKVIGISLLAAAGFLLVGSMIIKLVEFGRRLGSAFATIGRGAAALISKMTGVTGANTATAASATAAAEAEAALELAMASAADAAIAAQTAHETAQAAVNAAYQNGAAAIKIAESEVQLALEQVAAAAGESASVQEEAQVTLEAAYTNLSTTVSRVQVQIAVAESTMADEVAAGSAAQEESLATLTAARQAAADAAAASAAETSAASGAAFGPIGIAIGAVVGVGVAAAGALGLFGKSAKKQVGPVDELTSAIERDNEALGINTRKTEAQRLQHAGLLDAGLKLGLNQKLVTDAVLGNAAAMDKVKVATKSAMVAFNEALSKQPKFQTITGAGGYSTQVAVNETVRADKAYATLTDAQKRAYDAAKKLQGGLTDETAAVRASQHAAHNLAVATDTAKNLAQKQAVALEAVKKKSDDLADSYKGLNVQVAEHNTSLDPKKGGKSAQSNIAFIESLIKKTNSLAQAEVNSGTSVSDANRHLDENLTKLADVAEQSGMSRSAVQRLINTYKLTPKKLVTQLVANISKATASADQLQHLIDAIKQGKVPEINADTSQGRAVIKALQDRIDAILQKSPTKVTVGSEAAKREIDKIQQRIDAIRQNKVPGIEAGTANANNMINELQDHIDSLTGKTVYIHTVNTVIGTGARQAKAGGGRIFGPGTETSDDVLIAASNDEHMWSAYEVKRAGGHSAMERMRALARAGRLRGIVPGFASGGKVDKNKISSAIGAIGTPYSNPIDINSIGIERLKNQIANAVSVLNSEIAKGLSAAAAAGFKRDINEMAKEAEDQLTKLRFKINHHDMDAIRSALGKTVDETKTAFGALLTDLKAAGSPDSLINSVVASESTIVAAQSKLEKYKAMVATAKAAVIGSFDLSTALDNTERIIGLDKGGHLTSPADAGGESLVRDEEQKAADAKAFVSGMKKLVSWLPDRYYQELLGRGPAALPTVKALLGLSTSQRKRFIAGARSLYYSGVALGTASGTAAYGDPASIIKNAMNSLAGKITGSLSKTSKSNDDLLKELIGRISGKHYAGGGWTAGTEYAMVHRREYMLSESMLAGRQSIDPRVAGMVMAAQVRAATSGMSGTGPWRGAGPALDTRDLAREMALVGSSVRAASQVEAAMLARLESAMRYVGPDAATAINNGVGSRAQRLRRTTPSVRHP